MKRTYCSQATAGLIILALPLAACSSSKPAEAHVQRRRRAAARQRSRRDRAVNAPSKGE